MAAFTRSWAIFAVVSALSAAGCSGTEARKSQYLERGDRYFAEANYEKARVEYSNALQIDPKNARARYQSGQVAEKLNNPRDALGNYLAALEADAEYLPARAAAARLYVLAGASDKAMEYAEPGLVKHPDDAGLLTVRAAVRARNGQSTEALADAEKAVKNAPDNAYALAMLASLYRSANRTDEAIATLQAGVARAGADAELRVILADLLQHAGRGTEAEAQLQKIIELEPRELVHRQRLARLRLLNKDVDGAERALREAIAVAPADVDARLALIEMLAAQRGFEPAERELQAMLAKQAADTTLQLAAGRFYQGFRKPAEAEAVYRKVVAAAGTNADGLQARDRLAVMLLQKNDVAGAETLIGEVLLTSPRDSEALALRGAIALSRGNADAAITDLRAVLREQPESVPVMRQLARAYLQNGDNALAEDALRAAVQVDPRAAATRLDLAALLAQSGRSNEVRAVLDDLIKLDPANMDAHQALFRLQLGQRQLADARRTAEEVRRLRPDLALGPFFVALIDEAEKKTDAARAGYERALQLQPEAVEPFTALVRLEMNSGGAARALQRVDTAIAKDAGNLLALNLRGELLMTQKRHTEAVAAFDATIDRSPKWWQPYRGKALTQMASGQNDAAIATLKAGGTASAGSVELASDLAALYQRLGRYDDAIAVYEDLNRRHPQLLVAANNLAMLLVSNRSDRASLDRAARLADTLARSREPSFINTRGWVRYKRGEVRESLPLLQQAVDNAPAVPLLRYHLGMAQYAAGDRTNAAKNLELALKSGTAFNGAEEARRTLEAARGKV